MLLMYLRHNKYVRKIEIGITTEVICLKKTNRR